MIIASECKKKKKTSFESVLKRAIIQPFFFFSVKLIITTLLGHKKKKKDKKYTYTFTHIDLFFLELFNRFEFVRYHYKLYGKNGQLDLPANRFIANHATAKRARTLFIGFFFFILAFDV